MYNLNLRGSFGIAGNNQNVTTNDGYTTYNTGFGYSYYGIAGVINQTTLGFYNSQIGNPLVNWERDKITNIGLDATVFKHFDLSLEWYKKAISGLLFPLPILATDGGGAAPVVNIGDVQNTGVDLSATYRGAVGRDFTFSIGANVTTYKNEITQEPNPGYFDFGFNRDLPIVRNQVGHPIGEFFGYKVLGIYQNASDIAKGPTY